MLAIRFPTSWNLSLGGGGSFTVATRFASGQGKKTDRFGRPLENNVSQLRGGRPLGEGTVVHGGATLNARQQRQMWLSSPGILIAQWHAISRSTWAPN
jgi:hypothetical protein